MAGVVARGASRCQSLFMAESDPAPADPDEPAVGARGLDQGEAARGPDGGPAGRSASGSLALLAVALLGAVTADAAGIGGEPGPRGWAWPGSFALLGAVGAAAVLALSLGLDRLRERRRG